MNIEETPVVKNYKISGLHGDKDIELQFNNPYKILVAENGTGKTTVLNSLFYLLTAQYQKLSQIEFERLQLLFANDEELELSRDDISPLIPENLARLPHYVHLKRFLGDELTGVLVQRYLDAESPQDFSATPEYKQANTKFPGPSSHFQQLFKSFSRELSREKLLKSC